MPTSGKADVDRMVDVESVPCVKDNPLDVARREAIPRCLLCGASSL